MKHIVGIILIILGVIMVINATIVYNFLNPHLTQMQAFQANWYYFVGGIILVIIGGVAIEE